MINYYKRLLFIFILVLIVLILWILWKCYKKIYKTYKYDLVVAAAFKNEAHILKEWINHYLYHGFDHIYLINDGSTDNYLTILQPFIDSGSVTLIHQTMTIDTYPRQTVVYNNVLRPVLHESKWWAILDLDEFLYHPEQINVKDYILGISDDVSQIHARWVLYGSNGHIEQPDLVVSNFLACKHSDDNDDVKSIFRSEHFIDFGVHTHNVKGTSMVDTKLLVNHYAIQSWKFFERVKMTRGDINLFVQQKGIVRDRAYFEKYDFKDKIDDRLAKQNRDIVL